MSANHWTNERAGNRATDRFIFSVFFPSLTLSWEGFTADGIEKTPPLMLFGPATALYAVLSLWVRPSVLSTRRVCCSACY